jgi:hypothetical protein
LNIKPANRLFFRLLQLFTLFFILALSLGGVLLMYNQPLPILTCRYVEPGRVDCEIQERVAWVVPVRERYVEQLDRAYVRTDVTVMEDEDGDEYNVYMNRVILESASGEVVMEGGDEMGFSSELTATLINSYLSTPKTEPLKVWIYGLWSNALTNVGGLIIFLLFGFLFLVALVDLIFGPGTVGKLLKIKKNGDSETTP